MKFSLVQTNLLAFIKFENKFEVKDYLLLCLNQSSSQMIKIYSRVISCQDRTSIFSQDNSNNKLKFSYSNEIRRKFTLKETNYGETTYCNKKI